APLRIKCPPRPSFNSLRCISLLAFPSAHAQTGYNQANRRSSPHRPCPAASRFLQTESVRRMDQTTEIINRVLPIFLLIGLGAWVRRSQFLPERAIDDLRKIVVNFALPSVLFVSFLNIEMQTNYLVLFVLTGAVCIALYALGVALRRRLNVPHPYFPFLMTGFDYAMSVVSFFGSA